MRRILALFLLFPLLFAPAQAQGRFGRSDFGINSHIASRDPDSRTFGAAIDAMDGAGWAREDFQWFRLEPQPGQYDFAHYDKAMSALASRGVNVIGVIGYPPGWATPEGGDGSSQLSFYPPDPGTFAVFASTIVSRYKDRVHHWEIWNEPENGLYFKPAPSPEVYTGLLRAVTPAIKQADPGALVLSGGIVPTNLDFIRGMAAAGAWGFFDVLALHPYVDPYAPEAGQIGAGDVTAVKSFVESVGSKPIWATEFGWSTAPADRDPRGVDQQTQAAYLIRGAALLRDAGVEKVLWYKLKDSEQRGDGPFNAYGIVGLGGGATDFSQQKASAAAFRTLSAQLSDVRPAGRVSLSGQQVFFDFESFGTWRRGDQANGTFTPSGDQKHGGAASGALQYSFPTAGNDYVVFTPRPAITIPGTPSQVGVWVYGDGSGHALKLWLKDAQGEVLQYRLGFVGAAGWSLMQASVGNAVEPYNRVSGGGNLRLDFPASVIAIVLDDEPDSASGGGTIYLDDMTAFSGPEAYGVRFAKGDGSVVDVLWATSSAPISLPTASSNATLVQADGGERTVQASGGAIGLTLGPSPVFLTHTPAGGAVPIPQPQPTAVPIVPQPQPPAPQPIAGAQCRSFAETGHNVCGRMLEFWEQNGGLPVFGYPITDQAQELIEGRPFQVQIFERNRLELHPENPRPYDVLLGRLGAQRLEASGRDWAQFPKSSADAPYYFAATGQAIAPEFQAYWSSQGLEFDGRPGKSFDESLALFGVPLSPAQVETNPTNGQPYLTQHFERARFEYHPENAGTPYIVLLGLLGREVTGIR